MGYEGTLCGSCSGQHYKSFPLKLCTKCPDPAWGWIIYIVMPLLLIGFWYPGLKWVYENTPSFFVTFTYLQISAVIGEFSFSTNSAVKTALALADTVNFNANLLMTDCSLGDSFLFKWLILQLLPAYFWIAQFVKHYYHKSYVDESEPDFFGQIDAIANSLRLSNLLYLPVAGSVMALYVLYVGRAFCQMLGGSSFGGGRHICASAFGLRHWLALYDVCRLLHR